jgi:hypothetical protein
MTKLYAFAGAALLATLFTAPATAQSAFPANTPLAVTKPGTNTAARNYTVASSSNTGSPTAFSSVTTFTPAYDINGIGLNPMDNKLYGSAYTGTTDTPNTMLRVNLLRIGANGVTANLGKLPTSGQSPMLTLGFNTRAEIPNYTAGAMDATGKYYYTTVGLKTSGVNKLMNAYIAYVLAPAAPVALSLDTTDIRLFMCWINNVQSLNGSNMPASVAGYKELNFSNVSVRAAVQNLLNNLNSGFPGNLSNLDGGLQDFAIHPVNGKIYGYISYPSGGNLVGRPVVFNPAIGAAGLSVITPVGTVVNTVPGVEVAGLQFNATGSFYGLFNNGGYSEINLSTGALVSIAASNLGTTGNNLRGDLASPVTAAVILPITLTSFEGRSYNTYNQLSWSVSPDSKITAFELERSSNGSSFEKIARVAPHHETNYQYADEQPLLQGYYRLLMIDETGKADYSNTVKLQAGIQSQGTKVYPSLLAAGAALHIESRLNDYTVFLINGAGQVVMSQSSNMQAVLTLQLPSGLASGNYWVKLVDNKYKEIIGTEKISIR